MQSKWGSEDQETLNTLERIKLDGKVLNVAAGDGRFTDKLLETATSLVEMDLAKAELDQLIESCSDNIKSKVSVKIADITKVFPFEDESFDGIFCTGTLHLFDVKTIEFIIKQMSRVLRKNGKIVFDFSTDIKRIKTDGSLMTFDGEGHYSLKQAIDLFSSLLTDFEIEIETATCLETGLNLNGIGYDFSCNFIIVSGTKL
jgi:Methylase involved in ubiquinone/menaquinone biosynthesis